MPERKHLVPASQIPCCPELETDPVCDVIRLAYRLTRNVEVVINDRRVVVPVEVAIRAKLARCSGPLALGDLVYSTTLLPGEKVKLFSQDRRTRFSFDSENKLSYRHTQMSEERAYMSMFAQSMSDISVNQNAIDTHQSQGSFSGHAEAGLDFFGLGVDSSASGSYNASSINTFANELKSHAQASHSRSEVATRAASSVSIGEVASRSHSEGETQDHFESASREFSNPNRCKAITFLFYQINKIQVVQFEIEAVTRRVIDPVDNSRVSPNLPIPRTGVTPLPDSVLATNDKRLEVENTARASVLAERNFALEFRGQRTAGFAARTAFFPAAVAAEEPFSAEIRKQALLQVDEELVKEGLLERVGGDIAPEAKARLSFESRSSLPTPGVIVKGCLDDCDICEPAVDREINLNLERKRLENELLKKQIELLEKSKEYRCCPVGEAEEAPADNE